MIEVRIKNFQSIEDSTLVIDGLTAITGANNSGKTAAMRAIRGVFTNPPASALVRHGCAYLSVSLSFDDGNTVTWEKGWEKPNQKGKTVNRYILNGKVLSSVGSGVPPEVEGIGVKEIQAASDRVWPQIADQFDGALFLVNRPGSAIAEALSDVDRVGKLTSALKLAEKDKRSFSSELKIRRGDVESKEGELKKYEGLDHVGTLVSDLGELHDSLDSVRKELEKLETFVSSLTNSKNKVKDFAGFESVSLPESSKLERLKKGSEKVSGLLKKFRAYTETIKNLEDFHVVLPDSVLVESLGSQLELAQTLKNRWGTCRSQLSAYGGGDFCTPEPFHVESAFKSLELVERLHKDLGNSISKISSCVEDLRLVNEELESAEAEVTRLLGDRGLCPTCKTVYTGTEAPHA